MIFGKFYSLSPYIIRGEPAVVSKSAVWAAWRDGMDRELEYEKTRMTAMIEAALKVNGYRVCDAEYIPEQQAMSVRVPIGERDVRITIG